MLPALSLIKGVIRTDSTESGRNPCIKNPVMQQLRTCGKCSDAYFKCSADIPSSPQDLLESNYFIASITMSALTIILQVGSFKL